MRRTLPKRCSAWRGVWCKALRALTAPLAHEACKGRQDHKAPWAHKDQPVRTAQRGNLAPRDAKAPRVHKGFKVHPAFKALRVHAAYVVLWARPGDTQPKPRSSPPRAS